MLLRPINVYQHHSAETCDAKPNRTRFCVTDLCDCRLCTVAQQGGTVCCVAAVANTTLLALMGVRAPEVFFCCMRLLLAARCSCSTRSSSCV